MKQRLIIDKWSIDLSRNCYKMRDIIMFDPSRVVLPLEKFLRELCNGDEVF